MLQQKIYLVLGIGTDVGKTFLIENLCKVLLTKFSDKNSGGSLRVIKPICTGFIDGDTTSDPAKILLALKKEISRKNLDDICPWRFADAVSPNFAANINFLEVKKFCLEKIEQAKKNNNFLFIESAGGVMTPISEEKTFLDLAQELKIPVILVSSNYLGSISHTLCSIKAIKSCNILLEKILLNNRVKSSISDSRIIQTLENLSNSKVVAMASFLEGLSNLNTQTS